MLSSEAGHLRLEPLLNAAGKTKSNRPYPTGRTWRRLLYSTALLFKKSTDSLDAMCPSIFQQSLQMSPTVDLATPKVLATMHCDTPFSSSLMMRDFLSKVRTVLFCFCPARDIAVTCSASSLNVDATIMNTY